jgi:hypothetical protein
MSDTARHRTSPRDAAKLPRIMEHCSRMLARPALQEAGLPKTHKSTDEGFDAGRSQTPNCKVDV